MAYYLQMDGVDDYLVAASAIIDRVVVDCSIDSTSTNANLYIFAPNGGSYVDASTMNTAFSYCQKSNMTVFRNSLTSMKFDGGSSVTSKVLTSNQRYVIDYGFNAINDSATEYFINSARVGTSTTKGKIYRITAYYLGAVVYDYDMTLGNVTDQSGNGRHATLTGGTWVSSGTTHEASATITGVSTLTASATLIHLDITGSASVQGVGTLTATADIVSPAMTGSASITGVGTLTAAGVVISSGVATLTGVSTLTAFAEGLVVPASASLIGVGYMNVSAIEGASIISSITLYAREETTVTLSASEELTVNLYALTTNSVILGGGP